MKTVYLDCFAGISGDMLVGALIDLGVSPETLTAELGKLALESEYRIQISRVNKRGIQAVQFKVLLASPEGEHLADTEFQEMDLQSGSSEPPSPETGHEHSHEHPHVHDHEHEHQHGQDHGHEHTHEHTHEHEHRSLPQITSIIEASTLSPFVKQTAREVFNRLAEAEGKVHGVPPDEVHFHEVGGVDAIIDIVSVAIGLEQLGVEQVIASPLHLGGGFINIQHGLYPVPAPATANLVTGVPVYTSDLKGELVTPTGAAILTTVAKGYGAMPVMTVETVGYGAGTRDREFPNVLRGFYGKTDEPSGHRKSRTPFENQHADPAGPAGYHTHPAVMIEANLDDMTPQLFGNLMEKLLEVGALDVWFVPIQMKKNRPGMLLQVLAHPTSLDDLATVIFRESTSIGLRTYEVTKRMLQRETVIVQTPYGPVGVKLAYLGNEQVNVLPEYEDCRELARQCGIPLKEIYIAACMSAREQINLTS